MMKPVSLVLILSLSSMTRSNGFVPPLLALKEQTCCQAHNKIEEEAPSSSSSSQSRRHWISSQFQSLLLVGGVVSEVSKEPASAAVMAVDQQKIGSLGIPESKERFVQARKDVQYLLDHYESISKEGGDAVRRYLGTVGVAGAMYGISKVVKTLREEAEDIVEYTEAMDEFNAYLYQAEGAAYQSIFAEHSSAKATPESCLATAKQDVVMMAKYMDKLQAQLSL
ncbi:unnamed protein product [Cylindrotheca closterium]|uniref:Uncharacterized protein n=1 Tax=Cylindrotheca closterium TaxID=2856 RepID=A0AAD2JHH5_9STRA|nr:unnamed protein product [Cylindrotheca closterium]